MGAKPLHMGARWCAGTKERIERIKRAEGAAQLNVMHARPFDTAKIEVEPVEKLRNRPPECRAVAGLSWRHDLRNAEQVDSRGTNRIHGVCPQIFPRRFLSLTLILIVFFVIEGVASKSRPPPITAERVLCRINARIAPAGRRVAGPYHGAGAPRKNGSNLMKQEFAST
jgi:hypothetical protein